MKIRELSIGLLVAALPVTVSSTAFALPINFTDGSWNAAQGATSFTMHSSNIDLFASGGTLTVNYVGGPSGDNSGDDGLGINDDEITQGGAERLTLLFSAPVTLDSVKLTVLFLNEGPTGQSEVGLYSLNGGAFTSFASAGAANGALSLNIFQSGISSIAFKSANDGWSDYSVKGLTYQNGLTFQTSSIPEPSTVLLLAIALLGLAAWRWKRAA